MKIKMSNPEKTDLLVWQEKEKYLVLWFNELHTKPRIYLPLKTCKLVWYSKIDGVGP